MMLLVPSGVLSLQCDRAFRGPDEQYEDSFADQPSPRDVSAVGQREPEGFGTTGSEAATLLAQKLSSS